MHALVTKVSVVYTTLLTYSRTYNRRNISYILSHNCCIFNACCYIISAKSVRSLSDVNNILQRTVIHTYLNVRIRNNLITQEMSKSRQTYAQYHSMVYSTHKNDKRIEEKCKIKTLKVQKSYKQTDGYKRELQKHHMR